MPCSRCGCDFGLFKKEHSCKNCGYAFCGSCLSKKAKLPNKGDGKPVSVCNKCFQCIEKNSGNPVADSTGNISPPAALVRRMEELESKGATANYKVNRLDSHKPNNIDLEISKRLENLRGNQPPAASVEEIQTRLANMKGVDPNIYWNKSTDKVFKTTLPITNVEQSQQLFDRYKAEVEMANNLPDPDEEIAARLAKLRGEEASMRSTKNKTKDLDPSDVLSKMLPPPPSTAASDDRVPTDDEMRTAMGEAHAMLNSVRSKSTKAKSNQNVAPACDDEVDPAEVDKIVEHVMAKAKLEENAHLRGKMGRDSSPESDDSLELPWCEICNGDAQVRCYDCDSDLYCNRCFKECHDEFDIRHHKTVPYKPPART